MFALPHIFQSPKHTVSFAYPLLSDGRIFERVVGHLRYHHLNFLRWRSNAVLDMAKTEIATIALSIRRPRKSHPSTKHGVNRLFRCRDIATSISVNFPSVLRRCYPTKPHSRLIKQDYRLRTFKLHYIWSVDPQENN